MPEPKKKKPLSVGNNLADLNKHAESVKINIKTPQQCRQYCVSVNDVFKKADARYHDGDEENSYILFMRYFHILESIKKTYEYQKHQKQYNEVLVPSNALKAIERAETLSNSLKARYEQLYADRSSSKVETAKSNADKDNGLRKQNDVTDGQNHEEVAKNTTKQNSSQSNGANTVKPDENRIINYLPNVPDIGNSIEAEPEAKKAVKTDPWITPEELYGLLKSADPSTVLILDTRPPGDYESSRIKHSGVVNIPEELLRPGANVNSIERRLARDVWEIWITRKLKSHVIILDSETKRGSNRPDAGILILKDAIYRWDSSGSLETEPRLLDSGFCGWYLYYPSLCTNPFYKKPKAKQTHTIPDATSLLLNLDYPMLPGLGSRSMSEGTGLAKTDIGKDELPPSSKRDVNQSKSGSQESFTNLEPKLDRSKSEVGPRIGNVSGIRSNADNAEERLRRQISSPAAPKNKESLPGFQQGTRGHLPGDAAERGQSPSGGDAFRQRQGSLERSNGADAARPVPSLYSRHKSGPAGSNPPPNRPPPPSGRPATAPVTSMMSPNFKRRFGPDSPLESPNLPPSSLSKMSESDEELYQYPRRGFGSSLPYSSLPTPHSAASGHTPSATADDIVHAVYQAPTFGGVNDKSKSLPPPVRQMSGPPRIGTEFGSDRNEPDILKAHYHSDYISRQSSAGQTGVPAKPIGPVAQPYGPLSLPSRPDNGESAYLSPSKSRQQLPDPSSPGKGYDPVDKFTVSKDSQVPPLSQQMASSMAGYGYNAKPLVPGSDLSRVPPGSPQPRPTQPPIRPASSFNHDSIRPEASAPVAPVPKITIPSSSRPMVKPQNGPAAGSANQNGPKPAVPDNSFSRQPQRQNTAHPSLTKSQQPAVTTDSPEEPEFVTSPGLPHGWEKRIEPKTGRVYYMDHRSKSTHWELPPDFYAARQRDSTQRQKRKAPEVPAAKDQLPSASDRLHGAQSRVPDAKEQPQSSLKRSLSTPNLAEMEENKENVQPLRPTIDRSSKPLQKTSQLVDRSSKPLSKTRLTSLSPVYGSKGRNLTGLKNLGNTCYMNSVIQSLSNTVPLARYFFTGNYTKDLNPNSMNRRPEEVAKELAFLINVLWSGQYRSVSPHDFKSAIGRFATQFAGTKQQDAHEFLMFFMDGIHEDTNKVRRKSPMKEQNNDDIPEITAARNAWQDYTKSNDSVVVDLFQGQFRSTVACKTCSKKSVTFDVFSCLPLQLTSKSSCSLEDCIHSFTRPEMIGGNNSWKCSSCKTYREATKTLEIWKLPPVIIVQLKRFSSDGIWHNKLQTSVDFPINDFKMSKHSVGPRPDMTSYSLFAVINHYGSFESGHYTAYCRNQNKWYCYDDNVVRDIDRNSIKTSAAYLLFYTTMNFK